MPSRKAKMIIIGRKGASTSGRGTVENVGLVDRFEYQMKHAKDAKLMYVPRQRLGRGKEHFGGLD
jgi:uridine kinase